MNGEKVAYFSDLPAGTYEYVDAGFASEEDAAALTEKYPDGLTGKIRLSRAAIRPTSRGHPRLQQRFGRLPHHHEPDDPGCARRVYLANGWPSHAGGR